MVTKNRIIILLPILLLLALVACAEVSPSFGQRFRGRTLDVVILTLERVPEVRYFTTGPDQVRRHYSIGPSSDDMEMILMHLKVENHTATSAIVDIREQSAELRDFVRGRYSPIDVNQRIAEVSAPENPADERPLIFLWNRRLGDGSTESVELKQGFGLDGWMVFEAPRGTKFRDFRWRSGDSVTIDF